MNNAVLSNYEGSFIIVSHDRDFLEPLITTCIDFEDGRAHTTHGTVSDYLRRRHTEAEQAAQRQTLASAEDDSPSRRDRDRERKREEAAQRQSRYRELKPLKNEL